MLDGRGYRPDLASWRRERAPRRYHQAGVPHYWIIDQVDRTLTVHRHATDGYLVALRCEEHERVRAEPFDAIELDVAVLLGGDPA